MCSMHLSRTWVACICMGHTYSKHRFILHLKFKCNGHPVFFWQPCTTVSCGLSEGKHCLTKRPFRLVLPSCLPLPSSTPLQSSEKTQASLRAPALPAGPSRPRSAPVLPLGFSKGGGVPTLPPRVRVGRPPREGTWLPLWPQMEPNLRLK